MPVRTDRDQYARQLFCHSAVVMEEVRNELDPGMVAQLREGDRDAFERMVECYERPMFNLAWRMLGNNAEAADATQNVFMKVFEHIGDYDPQYRLFSWIYRIAVNESIDRLNLRKRAADGDHRAGDMSLESGEAGPDELVGSGQMHDLIQAALMELQQDYRAIIVLRHFSECRYSEIAEILQIPEKTVKSRLYSARQEMRKRLSARGVVSA